MINTYPKILSQQHSDGEVSLLLWIDPQCDYFKGHFDQQPIFPGLGQIDFAIKMASEHFGLAQEGFRNIPQIKFMRVISPDDEVTLILKFANRILQFSYAYGSGLASQGKVQYVE